MSRLRRRRMCVDLGRSVAASEEIPDADFEAIDVPRLLDRVQRLVAAGGLSVR